MRIINRFAKLIYMGLIIVSAIIVAIYMMCRVLISKPDVKGLNSDISNAIVSGESAASDHLENHVPTLNQILGRKDGCYTFLAVASDKSGLLADAIMVAMYDVESQRVGVVSIPRDTLLEPGGIVKYPKINSAYMDGIDTLKTIVSDMLGIPIDFYITVDMDGFVELVDSIGGIDFDVPVHMSYDDIYQGLSIHYEPGVQHLSGQQALEVCRLRYNQDGTIAYPDYDIGRTKTQRDMLVTVAKKVLSHPQKLPTYVELWRKYVETNLSVSDMLWFVNSLLGTDISNDVHTEVLPGNGETTYKNVAYCYQLYPEQVLSIVNQFLNPFEEDLTSDDLRVFVVS